MYIPLETPLQRNECFKGGKSVSEPRGRTVGGKYGGGERHSREGWKGLMRLMHVSHSDTEGLAARRAVYGSRSPAVCTSGEEIESYYSAVTGCNGAVSTSSFHYKL